MRAQGSGPWCWDISSALLDQQDDFTLVSLGDWISHYSYAELVDGSFRLLTYPA